MQVCWVCSKSSGCGRLCFWWWLGKCWWYCWWWLGRYWDPGFAWASWSPLQDTARATRSTSVARVIRVTTSATPQRPGMTVTTRTTLSQTVMTSTTRTVRFCSSQVVTLEKFPSAVAASKLTHASRAIVSWKHGLCSASYHISLPHLLTTLKIEWWVGDSLVFRT